jgi:hypothetical protein
MNKYLAASDDQIIDMGTSNVLPQHCTGIRFLCTKSGDVINYIYTQSEDRSSVSDSWLKSTRPCVLLELRSFFRML